MRVDYRNAAVSIDTLRPGDTFEGMLQPEVVDTASTKLDPSDLHGIPVPVEAAGPYMVCDSESGSHPYSVSVLDLRNGKMFLLNIHSRILGVNVHKVVRK